MTTWIVRGCGVAFICDSEESLKRWIEEIIRRGGVPEVQELKEETI